MEPIWSGALVRISQKWPLKEYLHFKSSRSAAAIEELRVDLETICALEEMSAPMAKKAGRLILCERAFRYGLSFEPQSNFDAISSNVFFNFMLIHGGFALTREGRLEISNRWIEVVHSFREVVSTVEADATPATLSQELIRFARQWGEHSTNGGYKKHPFFVQAWSGF